MFARAVDMEPDMAFHHRGDLRTILRFVGVEPVVSRFPGKRRVRVFVKSGPPFIAEYDDTFPIVVWGGS